MAMANGPVHLIFLAFAIAPNAAEALQRMARYKIMFGPVALELAQTSCGLLLEVIADDPTLILPDCLAASIGIFLVEKCRNLSARRIVPINVALPPDALGFEGVVDFLGRKPTPGSNVRFGFAAGDMAAPFLSENPDLWHDIRNDLEGQLARRSGAGSFADEFEVAIRRALTYGPARVDTICHDLGISRSTMLRRLVEVGTTYQQLLNGVRLALATRYLTKSDIHLPEITRLVGFSDAKSFYRAFKSWTGQPPGTFREASASLR